MKNRRSELCNDGFSTFPHLVVTQSNSSFKIPNFCSSIVEMDSPEVTGREVFWLAQNYNCFSGYSTATETRAFHIEESQLNITSNELLPLVVKRALRR